MIRRQRKGWIGILLLVSTTFPVASFAQQLSPAIPYELSIAVQEKAKELKVWNTVTKDFGYSATSFPVLFPKGQGWQPLQAYLDQLTAADVMAGVRAKQFGRSPQPEDYEIMFASWCIFVPNKPPATDALKTITMMVQKQLLVGLYINSSKRAQLVDAMGAVLLKGSMPELFKILSSIRSIADYNRNVLNTEKLK
jgi:hypothetical protein